MALRGYRMSDVDWALDKMADEIDRLRDEVARCRDESGGDTPAPMTAHQMTAHQVTGCSPAFPPDRMADLFTSPRARPPSQAPVRGTNHDRAGRSLRRPGDRSGDRVRRRRRPAVAGEVDHRDQAVRRSRARPRFRRSAPGWRPSPGCRSIGFLDTMVVTEYDPPWRWVTQQDGDFVHGVGIMQVEPLADGCRVTWANELDLPFGILGRLGWPLVRPRRPARLYWPPCKRMAKQLVKGNCRWPWHRRRQSRRMTASPAGTSLRPPSVTVGQDGLARCWWGAARRSTSTYHDQEWGRPLHGDDALYERLCLEAFQSGLSWLTILRKRPSFRRAFDGFVIERVATFGTDDVERLMADASIVRNRAKIEAVHQQRPGGRRAGHRSRRTAVVLRPGTPRRQRPVQHGRPTGDHGPNRPRWPRISNAVVSSSSDRRPPTP